MATRNSEPKIVDMSQQVRDARSTQYFWSTQIVSAYESSTSSDADENSFSNTDIPFAKWYHAKTAVERSPYGLVGYLYLVDGLGPSVVFTEEIRDLSEENNGDMQELADAIVVSAAHEAMHRFYGWHEDGMQANENLIDGANALASEAFRRANGASEYKMNPTSLQFHYLQSRTRPS